MIRRLILLIIVAVIATRMAKVIYIMGFHKMIYKHQPGPCRLIPGLDYGSEDITTTSNGLAFISSGVRIPGGAKVDPSRMVPNIRGRIYLFDYNRPQKNAVELTLNGDFDRDNFYPHGISLYEDPNTETVRLFVVNHHISDQERIEIFRFDENTTSLDHLKTVTGENILSVNDIVAIGPDSFYFINDMYFFKDAAKTFEMISGIEWGSIGLYDGKTDRIAMSGYAFPNGINVSPDGRYLYATSALNGILLVFRRKEDNSVEEIQRVSLGTVMDNIEIDKQTGDLWIGCQPAIYMMTSHSMNVSEPAGSQVLRIRFNSNSAPYADIAVREVFMDDGSLLSASSVASYYDNKMLIGTVLSKTAFCEIKAF
ncbi:serum paraoxonase/arylesterase 2-like [Glandiceps talaboti]